MTKAEKKICIKECKLIQIKLFAADSMPCAPRLEGAYHFQVECSLAPQGPCEGESTALDLVVNVTLQYAIASPNL